MTNNLTSWPADPVLVGVMPELAPERLLRAWRAQFNGSLQEPENAGAECRIIEALYDPGKHVRIAYGVALRGAPPERVWPQGLVFYVRHPVRPPMSRRGAVLRLGNWDVEVYRLPNDRRLRGLRKFSRRDRAAEVWQHWLNRNEPGLTLQAASLRRSLLRYVPEQKFIIRLAGQCRVEATGEMVKRAVVVRSSRPRDCDDFYSRSAALRAAGSRIDGAFRMPRPLALDDRLGLLAVKWVWGDSLLELLQRHSAAMILERVATGLDAFHRTKIDGLKVVTPEDYLRAAYKCAADLSLVLPSLGDEIGALLAELSRQCPEHDGIGLATVHHDFHWNQVRGRPDRLTVLDFERCALGDPWFDVATFVTQVQTLPLRADVKVSPEEAHTWAHRFLLSWEARTRKATDLKRLSWYSAVALLILARGMLRHLRPGWAELAQRCVDLARTRLSHEDVEVLAR